MKFIDTHTHLYLPEFDDDRDVVINNAIEKNIEKMVLPNIDSTTINNLLDLSKKYPQNCFPAIGLHPSSVDKNYKEELSILEKYLERESFYAIGEIGIDLYWDKTFIKEQEEAFLYQINLAKRINLPIIIHARDSFDEIFKIVEKENNEKLNGIFHSFTGNIEQANKIIQWGFKIGLGGILTFKNSNLDKVVKEIDLKHIVLETDSPYLAPTPKRGKRNESSYLVYIAEKIAQIKNISISEVAQVCYKNSCDVFKFN
ncbi:MAG: TatD family hydrolase [Bacteroidota bacterium]|nr:TatD family hydrolase [Bacteroidota bacterium]